jgi:ribose-phosphate pyrophosphokinase
MNKLEIFTGNANPHLARDIAQELGKKVGEMFVGRFSEGDRG